MIPDEVKYLAEQAKVSQRIVESIWNNNSLNLIDGTLCYDINLIKSSVHKERRDLMWNTIDIFDKNLSNNDIIQKILFYGEKIFSIDDVIYGKDYIDFDIINKIGINAKMLCKNNKYCTYAACHHCYSNVKKIPGNYMVTAHCYRMEDEYNVYRRHDFDMFEIVSFDTAEKLNYYKWEYMLFIISILNKANISEYHILVANDSFMTDDNEKLLYQILSKSKIEVVAYSKKFEKNIAVASINLHRKNFINKFNLSNDVSYDSMCFGIGIDRLKNLISEYSF